MVRNVQIKEILKKTEIKADSCSNVATNVKMPVKYCKSVIVGIPFGDPPFSLAEK